MAASGRHPVQLSDPPPWLNRIALPIIPLSRTSLFQCHGGRGPLNFNPTRYGRFNAPASEYATTYLSTSVEGAFVEAMVQDAPRSSSGAVLMAERDLAARCLCDISHPASARPLRVVDLTGNGLNAIGATNELCSLADLDRLSLVQQWALAIHQHPDQPDGIYYRARHDPSCISIGLFDRADGVLAGGCSTNHLRNPSHLDALLSRYRIALV